MKNVGKNPVKNILQIVPIPSLSHIFCGICIILVSLAYYFTDRVSLGYCMPYHVFAYGIATPFVLSFIDNHQIEANGTLKLVSLFLAVLFSQFVALGFSFHRHHDWDLCFGDLPNLFIWIAKSICYSYVFYKIILFLACLFEKRTPTQTSNLSLKKWFIILLVCRFVFLGIFYPCIFGFDAAVGLRTLLDIDCATCNHHPYFVQLIHALFFRLGQQIEHISIAMALLSSLWIVISSCIIIYGLRVLKNARMGKKSLFAIAFIYSVFPIFPYLSINPTKDGLFAYFFLLYLFTVYEIYSSKGTCFYNWKYLLLHGASIIMICVTRHQGFWFAAVEVLFLLLSYRQLWKYILATSLSALSLSYIYSNKLLDYLDVEPGGRQEVYGTFFQQTARFVKLYPTEVTETERQAINRVLEYDDIANKYVFDRTDPVKNGYKFNPWYRIAPGFPSMFKHIDRSCEKEALAEYRKAWFSMGLRHPMCYIEATMGVCFGFFYNNNRLILETEPFWSENGAATTPQYRFAHTNTVARLYNKYIYRIFDHPFLNWPVAIAYYNWIAIFLLAILYYKKDRNGSTIFMPVLLSILILLICPMIYGRYVYPVVMALPLFAAFFINQETPVKE